MAEDAPTTVDAQTDTQTDAQTDATAPAPAAQAVSQGESPAAPAAIDADAVAAVAAILPDWLRAVQVTHRLTGVQAAIWHDGQVVAEAAAGPADAVAGIDLLTTHRLRIASHSKTFTAITLLALAQAGRLRLDDVVGDHVPELAQAPVAHLTLRDLLSHAAGLTRDSADAAFWQLGASFPDREQLLAVARQGAVVMAPGEHLQYSNIGYGLLGLVIEAVCGLPYPEAVREIVLAPLGIEDVGPDLPDDAAGPEDPHGFALGHTPAIHGERRLIEQVPTHALAAATGFWATAAGVASVFARVLCDGEILDAASRRTMRRRVWTIAEGRHYGLGLQEGTLHGFDAIGHSGGFPTGLSRTWALPASRLAVSVIGTAADSPASDIAAGILGLLSLASGAPAPQAGAFEAAAAGGGASLGRSRPVPLAEQDDVVIGGIRLGAVELAARCEGTYESMWGRSRLAVLGGRLFALDESSLDPAAGAIELAAAGTAPDPLAPDREAVQLSAWGDSGYGTYAEPIVVRMADGACTGIIETGQLLLPSARAEHPERVRAPRAD